MPNKKINQLDVKVAVSTDLMLVGDPTNGTAYKSTLATLPLVPTSRTLTINGVAFDLSANRTWTIDALPSQTGNAGKYLTTNGTAASWATIDTSGFVATTRTISTTSPLVGGGDLSANRTLSIPAATTSVNGYLTSTDWTTFNSKQAALSGTGFVKISGTTISYDNSTYYLASNPSGYTSNVGTVTSVGLSMPSAFTVGSSPITSSGTLAVTGNGSALQYIDGTGALKNIFTGYDYEIHVSQVDGNDTTGNGDLLTPVASITKALTLVDSQRKTIIVHPGTYTENPSITVQYTVITTFGLVGGNTLISGTLSTNTGCTIEGIKMTNLTISNLTGTGNVNILNCEISGTLSKSSTGDYTLIRFCDIGITNITSSAGLVAIFGGNPNFITINNAGARVIVKNAVTIAPVLTAGNANFVDTIILATTSTSNALTTSAGTIVTLANSQIIVPTFNNVARVSLSGFYSIFNTVFDKPNSTLIGLSATGGPTDSIDYFQFINADKFIKQGGTSSQFLKADGSVDSSTYATSARLINTTSPLVGGGDLLADRTLSIPAATTSVNGYLTSADWTTFNGKESSLTFSSPLSRATNTISIPLATTSVSGYLSSTDWTTFNAKQAAITLTTTGTSGAATLVGATLNIPQYSGGGITGSGVANQLTYWSGTSSVTGSTGLTYVDSTGIMTLSKNQNAQTILEIKNTTSGTNSGTVLSFTSPRGAGSASIFKQTSANTTYKIIKADDFGFYNGNDGAYFTNIVFLNDTVFGKIIFGAGGASTEQMTLTAAGRLLLGTTTESTYIFDAVGTARISSSITASSFIKSSGTSAQILAADGSVVTAGTNITISGGTISSSGGGSVDELQVALLSQVYG